MLLSSEQECIGRGDSLMTALHELNEVREKHVTVSFTEAVDIVRHLRQQEKYCRLQVVT